MDTISRREATRSRTWPETTANLEVRVEAKTIWVCGTVADIGARGMFLKTARHMPVPANARISIVFDTDSRSPDAHLTACGEIVRRCAGGVGIRFTAIDLGRLMKCVIARMNRIDAVDPGARYHLGSTPPDRIAGNVYSLQQIRIRKAELRRRLDPH